MYDYLMFDLDGTITNSGPGITNAVRYALMQQNLPIPGEDVLYKYIGPPLKVSFERYAGLTGDRKQKAIHDFRLYYKNGGKYESELYDGIADVIRDCVNRGRHLVLCSSKLETSASDILRHFELDAYFTLIGGGVDGVRSEKTEVISYCLELIDQHAGHYVDRSRIVMIGDREFDILGAADHGLDSIGVLFGFGDRKELTDAGATYLVSSAREILYLI